MATRTHDTRTDCSSAGYYLRQAEAALNITPREKAAHTRKTPIDPNFTAADALRKAASEAKDKAGITVRSRTRMRGIVMRTRLPGGCVLYVVPTAVWQRTA
jgi:hypothetical protein